MRIGVHNVNFIFVDLNVQHSVRYAETAQTNVMLKIVDSNACMNMLELTILQEHQLTLF